MEDVNRMRIVQAADELFNTRGYRSVTVSDIALRLGMSKKTIYQYFMSKKEIAEAVVDGFLLRVKEKFEVVEQMQSQNPLETYREIIMGVKSVVVRLHPLFLADIQKFLPELWKRIVDFRQQNIIEVVERILVAAQNKGLTRPINARLAALIFVESVQAVIQPEFFARNGFSIGEAIDTLSGIFIAGVARIPSSDE